MKEVRLVCGELVIDNKMLLMSQVVDDGIFLMPGGKAESHEIAFDALEREIMEELGVKISMVDVLNYNPYVCQLNIHGTPKIIEPHKCLELRWCSLDDVKRLYKEKKTLKVILKYAKKVLS